MEDGCCSGLLRIRHGRVDALLPAEQIPDGPVIDARDARVIPGIIDTHNHGTCGWSLEHPRGFARMWRPSAAMSRLAHHRASLAYFPLPYRQ